MNNTYARAYTEVLEILKYLPNEEYNRISKDKINFYEKNKENNYIYKFDSSKSLNEQNISREANAIIISLFRDFFATNTQKDKLNKLLFRNEQIYQDKLQEKYNPNNIFESIKTENVKLVIYKENAISEILNIIRKMFCKLKRK